MDYKSILEDSFLEVQGLECAPRSRLAYLSEYIFDFTTYDSAMDEFFADKAVEVCRAITNKSTFDYIKDDENHKWFLVMCNLPFFSQRIDWGTSIRGAWWSVYPGPTKFSCCGLYLNGEQETEWLFSDEEWEAFIQAIIDFSEQ